MEPSALIRSILPSIATSLEDDGAREEARGEVLVAGTAPRPIAVDLPSRPASLLLPMLLDLLDSDIDQPVIGGESCRDHVSGIGLKTLGGQC